MNLAVLLSKSAKAFAERPAVSLGTAPRLDYRALAHRVSVLAGAMRTRFGLVPGSRVAIAMSNCPEYVELLFGIWHAGLIAVPINARLHQREFAYILDHSGAKLCFATSDLAETIAPLSAELEGFSTVVVTGTCDYDDLLTGQEAEVHEVEPEATAWLFYTSGTTGRPKGAMLTHRGLLTMTLSYFADIDSVSETDCMIHAAPMSHGSGLYSLPFLAKGANQVFPESGRFDPDEVIELIGSYAGITSFLAPTMITRLINSQAITSVDTSHLKTIVYGGAPMYLEDLKRTLGYLGPNLAQIYGQGESPMTITALSKAIHASTAHPRYSELLTSAGMARTDVEVRVVDDNGRDLRSGETGEVVVRGDVVMKGYWKNEEATAETLRGGWLHTGDLGVFDGEGFLTLKDRSKDLIISGGCNIYPREVEEVLLRKRGVLEVAVVGRSASEWGEEVVAFVVLEPRASVTEDDLDRLCLENIARFKRPKAYRFLSSLPKNNYGKVLKTELRKSLEDGKTKY
jgi:acyl-CoA synthetase (AMP-forming)/AMP-acid ligase II